MTKTRWWMLALVFLATTVNYLDRNVINTLQPVIKKDLGFSDQTYGNIVSAFQFFYMIGFLMAGKLIDRFGVRLGYAIAGLWWTAAAALTPLAGNALQLAFWRGMLGLGEAGNFPAAVKAVSEWFPQKDQAFAVGIFNAGTNVATMIGPPAFVALNERYGWRACFLMTASVGIVWLVLWWMHYRRPTEHAGVNAEELAYIHSDAAKSNEPPLSWSEALRYRETWGFAAGKFFSDPVWWFYLSWLPPYLFDVRKLELKAIGWALPLIYLAADIGSVGGGWVAGALIRRGWSVGSARKLCMGLSAALMPVAALCVLADSAVTAIALVSIATFAHQAWSANLYATTPDVFPRNAVASVTGIGGAVGAFGGFLFSGSGAGFIIDRFGYTPAFLMMGTFHLTGFVLVHLLMGDLRPIQKKAQ